MKKYGLIISITILFLLINTSYYWDAHIGFLVFPITIIMFFAFYVIGAVLIFQIYRGFKKKITDKKMNISIVIVTIGLILIYLRPYGIIDYEKFEGENVLVAKREGSANCMKTLKLKSNNYFKERDVCFGIYEVTGEYLLKNDTIYFKNVEFSNNRSNDFYEFAVFRLTKYGKNGISKDLVRYKNKDDTIGHILSIVKNNLDDFGK